MNVISLCKKNEVLTFLLAVTYFPGKLSQLISFDRKVELPFSSHQFRQENEKFSVVSFLAQIVMPKRDSVKMHIGYQTPL